MIFRIICLVLLSFRLCGQTFNGAPLHGMGNTGLAVESIYSITNNTAGISNLPSLRLAVAYQPHYMTNKLRTQAVYIAVPTPQIGVFGFGIRNYGIAQLSSFLTANLAYAKSFGQIITSSFSANYHRYYVRDYISDHTFSINLGALIRFSETVNVGVLLRNATLSKFKDDTEQYLPMEAGAGWRKNNYSNLEEIMEQYPKAKIIIDGSNSDRTIERLQKGAESKLDRLYILKNNFAYVWQEE